MSICRLRSFLAFGAFVIVYCTPAHAIDVGGAVGGVVGGIGDAVGGIADGLGGLGSTGSGNGATGGLGVSASASVGGQHGKGVSVEIGEISISTPGVFGNTGLFGKNGLNANAGTALGSNNGLVNATASVNGPTGLNSSLNAGVLGRNGLVNANAAANLGTLANLSANTQNSLFGANGLDSQTGVNVGLLGGLVNGAATTSLNGTDINAGLSIGLNLGLDEPADPDGPTGPAPSADIVGALSNTQIAQFKLRCRQILRNPQSFGGDLVELCRVIQRSKR